MNPIKLIKVFRVEGEQGLDSVLAFYDNDVLSAFDARPRRMPQEFWCRRGSGVEFAEAMFPQHKDKVVVIEAKRSPMPKPNPGGPKHPVK